MKKFSGSKIWSEALTSSKWLHSDALADPGGAVRT